MKGYYCCTKQKREIFYAPYIFIGVKSTIASARFYYTPHRLEMLALAEKQGKISRSRLEQKGWNYLEIDIPDFFITQFLRYHHSKNRSKRKKMIGNIMFFMQTSALSLNKEDKENYENTFDNSNSEYDESDWWKRGEVWHEDFE
ncbi:MAG: hypothetical protein AABX16_01395 [Nanoarchaeota archaeon]